MVSSLAVATFCLTYERHEAYLRRVIRIKEKKMRFEGGAPGQWSLVTDRRWHQSQYNHDSGNMNVNVCAIDPSDCTFNLLNRCSSFLTLLLSVDQVSRGLDILIQRHCAWARNANPSPA